MSSKSISRKSRIVSFLLCFAMFFSLMASQTGAYAKGIKKVSSYNSKSSLIMIGDSRMYGLAKGGYKKKASFYAVCGGNYHDKKGKYSIRAGKSDVKDWIEKTIKKHGKCKVVILATINECHKGGNKRPGKKKFVQKNIIAYADELASVKVKYQGKNVKPSVFIFSAPRAHTKYNTINKKMAKKYDQVFTYNAAIRDASKGHKYTFARLGQPYNKEFKGDKLHFNKNSSYTKYMWKVFTAKDPNAFVKKGKDSKRISATARNYTVAGKEIK